MNLSRHEDFDFTDRRLLLTDSGVNYRQTPPPSSQSSYLAACYDAHSHIARPPQPSYATSTTHYAFIDHANTTHQSYCRTSTDYPVSRTSNHEHYDNNNSVHKHYNGGINLSKWSDMSNERLQYNLGFNAPFSRSVAQYNKPHDNMDGNHAFYGAIDPIKHHHNADRSARHTHCPTLSLSPSSSPSAERAPATTAAKTPIVGSSLEVVSSAQFAQIESIDQSGQQHLSLPVPKESVQRTCPALLARSTRPTHSNNPSSYDRPQYLIRPVTEVGPCIPHNVPISGVQVPLHYDPRYNPERTSSRHPISRPVSSDVAYYSARSYDYNSVNNSGASFPIAGISIPTTSSTAASSSAPSTIGESSPNTTAFSHKEYMSSSNKVRRPWPSKFEDQIFTAEDRKLPAVKRRRIYINSLEMHANLLYTLLEANGLVADQGLTALQARNKPKDTKLSVVKCQHEISCLRRRSAVLNELIQKAESNYPTDIQLSPHPFSKELML